VLQATVAFIIEEKSLTFTELILVSREVVVMLCISIIAIVAKSR
jgi:hypothetical protein